MSQQHCDPPTHYEIRLRGTLPQYWSGWFGGMTVTHDSEGSTLLSGPIVDQAELHGLLDKARDLGLALLEVRRVPRDEQSQPAADLERRDSSGVVTNNRGS